MELPVRTTRWVLLSLLLLPLALTGARTPRPDLREYRVVEIPAGPDARFGVVGAFLSARPGTVIELPAGVIDIDEELSLDVSHVIVRGRGMNKTVLRFAGQRSGGQGIFIRGDNVRLEDFAVEDTPGDGIRAVSDGITFRRVRVEWTRGADPGCCE